jgi:3D (Asp-Asp-Asp) domain-containing protein
MKRSLGSHLTLLAALGIGSVLAANVAQATQFDHAEIEDHQTRMVMMASPIGTTGNYKLLIFEQLNNRRQCWGEIGSNPTVIDPLFMQFDFTGICGRSTDSNAYSVRVGGQDLVGRYHLRLVRKANELVLIGFSLLDRDVEFFEIGRTRGLAEGMLKIELDPDWRLTRRSFRGKPIGHIYLTTDRSLPELANRATPITPEAPAPTPQPLPQLIAPQSSPPAEAPALTPQPLPQALPTPSLPQPSNPTPSSFPTPQPEPTPQASPAPTGNYVVPLVPQDSTPNAPVAAPKSLPSNWNSRPQSSVVVPVIMPTAPMPAPPSNPSTSPMPAAGFRVVVDQPSPEQQNQIRQLVPSAFRTTVNGQPVLQVGVFRDRAIANSLQQQLASQNLNARIVPTTIAAVPQPAPIVPVRPTLPLPNRVGSAFNLPQPTTTAQLTPTLLWSTYYYTHRAEAAFNPSVGTYPLLDRDGNNLGISLSHRDWCAAALQGSVQITGNQQFLGTYNFGGRGETAQVDCAPFYPRLRTLADTNRVRFRRSNTLYGEGVGGNSLVPYRTIAVDRTQIPIGAVVYIPDARGTVVTLPSGQQAVHDGYFYAADVGAAIKNNQIDVFIGVAERNPFRFIKSNPSGTFTAYVINDPRIQALLAAEHRAGAVATR